MIDHPIEHHQFIKVDANYLNINLIYKIQLDGRYIYFYYLKGRFDDYRCLTFKSHEEAKEYLKKIMDKIEMKI